MLMFLFEATTTTTTKWLMSVLSFQQKVEDYKKNKETFCYLEKKQ